MSVDLLAPKKLQAEKESCSFPVAQLPNYSNYLFKEEDFQDALWLLEITHLELKETADVLRSFQVFPLHFKKAIWSNLSPEKQAWIRHVCQTYGLKN